MDILVDKKVRIRKEQRCWGCARKFEKGTTLRFLKSVDGGDFFSNYWCPTCDEYWSRFMQNGDEVGLGDLKSEDKETWEALRLEVEGETVKDKSVQAEEIKVNQYVHYLSRDIHGNHADTWGYVKKVIHDPILLIEIQPSKGNILADTHFITNIKDILEIVEPPIEA